jgi:predicted transcriptional regulator
MANPERFDPFVSTEEEVEVDVETAAAIQRGIEDADAGRVVTLEQARERMQQWLSKSSSPIPLYAISKGL